LGAQKSQHSAGWYAGALLFWLLSAWLITVGLSSIIPQIFWPNGDAQSHEASCSAALRELRRELLSRTSERIAHTAEFPVASSRDELLAWFEGWDKRLFEARPSCREPERAAWTELGRLRHGMQALIERFEREEAPRIQRLEQLLGRDRAEEEARAHIPRKTTQHE
jgi:hypothetical protein